MNVVQEKLAEIQQMLHAPKDQYNDFGGYSYRSAESIMKAVKPLLLEGGVILKVSDDLVERGGMVYVEANATLTDGEHTETAKAYAREAVTQKGMSAPQCTGSASSFARKYALNGLFLIDDNKDADHFDNRVPEPPVIVTITAHDELMISELIKDAGADIANILKACSISKLADMPKTVLPKVLKKLDKAIKEATENSTKKNEVKNEK